MGRQIRPQCQRRALTHRVCVALNFSVSVTSCRLRLHSVNFNHDDNRDALFCVGLYLIRHDARPIQFNKFSCDSFTVLYWQAPRRQQLFEPTLMLSIFVQR